MLVERAVARDVWAGDKDNPTPNAYALEDWLSAPIGLQAVAEEALMRELGGAA